MAGSSRRPSCLFVRTDVLERDILEGKFVRFKKYGKTNWDELYLGVASHKLHKIGRKSA